MKILLIYPYFLHARIHSSEDIRVVPQGLHYIAALLKENHYDAEILNWHNIHETPEMIETVLRDRQPAVIGFSILHANRWGGIEIARIAREINPDVKIVFGGIGATFLWKHLLTHFKEIDVVVIGEGEYPFLGLIRHFNQETAGRIDSIKGLAFRKNGQIKRTEASEAICELDELPNPAKYLNYQHVSLTRGCLWNCHFCGSPQFWGQTVRFHSADYFVRQLEMLFQKGIRFFYVSDDTFTIKKRRTIEVCKAIIQKELAISWAAISRVNYVNEEVLYWMRKAGCMQISYGVESGSKKIRKVLNKNISNEQIEKAFALTQRYGILARAYFIYGCPQEDRESIQETIDLIKTIKPLSALFYVLDIFPGTELYAGLMKRLNLNDDIWLNRIEDILYFEVDPMLTKDMILSFGQELRSAFYKNLPDFVDSIQLIEDDEFDALHSDFCSRLAMTFDHGEYARIDTIPGKPRMAEKLYRKALQFHPNARAYLGLGILNQKKGEYGKAADIVSEGLAHFPDDVQLNICLAVGHMNLNRFKKALSHLLPHKHAPEALQYAARCYRALNDHRQAEACLDAIKNMQNKPG